MDARPGTRQGGRTILNARAASIRSPRASRLSARHTGRLRTGPATCPPLPGVFPDQMASVVRDGAGGRELTMMRWGFPPPPGVPGNRAVTNIRDIGSVYWRAWMGPANRCLVLMLAFCEYAAGKSAVPHWFALGEDRPLFAFGGLWRPWTAVRGTKADPTEGEHELFAFLEGIASGVTQTRRCVNEPRTSPSPNVSGDCGTPKVCETHSVDRKTAFERPLREPSRERIITGLSSKFSNVCSGSGLALSGVIPAARPQDAHNALAEIERLPGIAAADMINTARCRRSGIGSTIKALALLLSLWGLVDGLSWIS